MLGSGDPSKRNRAQHKTKIMIQTRKTIVNQVNCINNQEIERVDSFVYLGSSLSTTNDETIKIRRIFLASRAYFLVLHLIKSRTIYQKNKIRNYKMIRPILCYGCETWMMTRKSKGMLDAFERKILR
jgi:hypothetical protein